MSDVTNPLDRLPAVMGERVDVVREPLADYADALVAIRELGDELRAEVLRLHEAEKRLAAAGVKIKAEWKPHLQAALEALAEGRR